MVDRIHQGEVDVGGGGGRFMTSIDDNKLDFMT